VDPDGRTTAGTPVEGEDRRTDRQRPGGVERDFCLDCAAADQGIAAARQRLATGGVAEPAARAEGQAGGVEATAGAEGDFELPQLRQLRRLPAGRGQDFAGQGHRDRRRSVAGQVSRRDRAIEGNDDPVATAALGSGGAGDSEGRQREQAHRRGGAGGPVPHWNLVGLKEQ
jgi:hypothetical protein